MNTQKFPIGISDFKTVIEGDYYYVDKTDFIKEVINASSQVFLFPRPRRFGKTLNLGMLRYFFEKNDEDQSALFKGLAIQSDEACLLHQGKYPVIYMTFKDLKHLDWQACLTNLKITIYGEFARHRYLLEGDTLFPEEKKYFQGIIERSLPESEFHNALKFLSMFLHRFHKAPVVMLIDEYDTPIHAGYNKDYYDEIISFIRNFLSGGLKDNPYLYKGVLTGILRVAKESVFSGLNNLGVYTILEQEFNTSFGFTEKEVAEMLNAYNLSDRLKEVEFWYNGYSFGGETIYNPWSVLQFSYRKPKIPSPYWVNTADTTMIDRLATKGGKKLRDEIAQLLEGQVIIRQIYDSIVMQDLGHQDDLLWSFLLFCGYLKIAGEKNERNYYPLAMPNEEVRFIYEEMIKRWFGRKIESENLEEMIRALEKGDAKLFEIMLRKIVLQVMSYHDLAGAPEKVYHAFVLGMLVWMAGEYEIRSNRESGYGRYDLMLKPKDPVRQGIIIEFKKVEEEQMPEEILENAMEQIDGKKYVTELEAAGVRDILKIAVAFRGKELWVAHER